MKTFPGVLCISSISKFFVLFALILLFTNATIVNSQNSTNSANGNVANSNANAASNGNAGGSTTGNTTPSPNGNVGFNGNGNTTGNTTSSPNGNTNSNTNGNSNKDEEGRKKDLAGSYWFPAIMTLLFLGLFGTFTFIIARAIYYSGSTYRSPLGLPDGTFRAILAYTLVIFLGFYILAGVLSLSDFKPPDFLLGIIATVIGFYFGSRTAEDRGSGIRVGIVQGSVKDKNGTAAFGATVDLSQSGSKKFTQNADTLGNFKFDNVPVGDYDIKASLADQASDIVKLKVTTSQSQPLELKLK